MFRVLIADDDFEDRELLKMEIQKALGGEERDIRFFEAASVREAKQLLNTHLFDLMTLDIEFDRLSEGLEALPEIFENYPALNLIVISGKLNKSEVLEQLFRFTKDNVLKGKRWARHFDVLDKKDDKTEGLRSAHTFALQQREVSGKLRELFLLAESYLEKDMIDKCLEVYQKIQNLAPGERESGENIEIFRGVLTLEQALDLFRNGETVVASLLLGYFLETRLKEFTRRVLGGRFYHGLYDCLRELAQSGRVSEQRKNLFQKLVWLRNKAVHHPTTVSEEDFELASESLEVLEAAWS